MKKSRPVWFSPLQVWLPLGGVLSLLHRVSGLLLFLLLPLFLYTFGRSLVSQESFDSLVQHPPFFIKLVAFVTTWSLLHHILAGTRLLLMDIDVGKKLDSARSSAKWVAWLELLILLLLGGWLW